MKFKNLHINLLISKVFITYLLAFSMCSISWAQKLHNTEDSVGYFINLSEANWHQDIELASRIARDNYILAQKLDNPKLKAAAVAQYGISFYSNAEYDSALKYYNEAIQISTENKLSLTPYLIYKLAVLGKKSEYLSIINLIDEYPTKDDSLKIDLLLTQINAALEIGYTQKADSVLKKIEQIPEKLISGENELKIANQKGAYYSKTGNYKVSDSILVNVLDKYLEKNDYLNAAEVNLLLANNAMSLSKYKLTMDYLQKTEVLYEKVNYKYGLAHVLLEKATLYSYLNDFTTSSEQLFSALEFFEKNNNLNKIQRIYYELGWLHYKKDLFEKAENYADKSIAIAKSINNMSALGASYSLKGVAKMNLEENDSAIFFHDLSIKNYQKTGNKRSIATVLFNKAATLMKTGDEVEAIKIYRATYNIHKEIDYLLGIAVGEKVMGQYYLKKGQMDSAIYYLNMSEERTLNLSDDASLLDIYRSKSEYYSKINQLKNANDYLNKALDLQESIFDKQSESIFLELSTVYDLKNKEKELAFLNTEKEASDKIIALNRQKIRSQNYTLFALTIGLILLVITIYFIIKYTRVKLKTSKELEILYSEVQEKQEEIVAQSEELQESNDRIIEMNNFLEKKVEERTHEMQKAHAELDKFFYRASHDFRGPLTTMMGLVEVSKLTSSEPSVIQLFDNVNYTAKKLDKMVRKLQSVSFLSDFQDLPEPEALDLNLFIKETIDFFLKEYSTKEINFNIKIDISEPIFFYPNLLHICLNNLIENSINFNKNKVIEIKIFLKTEQSALLITIEDNGIGIDKDWQHNIFEMFEKSSDISKGNGLGLYLVKKAVTKLNGEIKFESLLNIGSTFYLKFPLVDSNKKN